MGSKIFIGADHNGFDMKAFIAEELARLGYEVTDEGDQARNPDDDFPQFSEQVVTGMKATGDQEARGILICGSGQGMCIAANRFKGIRAALVWNEHEARAARNDDDSNILCLPARSISNKQALGIAQTWLRTPFAAAPRFKRRIKQIDELG
ncbi:MAG: RpiB/LacA/LacB family sugar-phosphate isomerase [Candidatus Saccharimonadales bacterium]